jgi:hypothetical protein
MVGDLNNATAMEYKPELKASNTVQLGNTAVTPEYKR